MTMPKHDGVYRFKNVASTSGRCLSVSGTIANGRNVILKTRNTSDNAQKWRVMYAGTYGDKELYWINSELGGRSTPYALDRFMGTPKNNADIYKSVSSSAADQLIYFVEDSNGYVTIRLYANGYALAAASDANGSSSVSQLTDAGNCYWASPTSSNTQKWEVEVITDGSNPYYSLMATRFPAAAYYNATNNASYPNYVGECPWYCRGRFYEVNGVPNVSSGNANQWLNNTLPSGCAKAVGKNVTLVPGSVAVFNNQGDYGHVVFIESIRTNGDVIWSDCNGTTAGSTFAYSNGQIEVRGSSTLTNAYDAVRRQHTDSEFRNKFGGLSGIIYKT